MIIECSNCRAKYQYDEARFEGKASKKIRCARCKEVFAVFNPAMQPAGTPAAPVSAAATSTPAADPLDSTVTSRRRPVLEDEPEQEETASAPAPTLGALKLPETHRLSVAILDGEDSGKVYRIEKPRIVIGRAGADLEVNDPETSRIHAAIEVHEGIVVLRDLDSTNGTYFDGEKLEKAVELQSHAEFRIGSTTLMLIVTEAE
ncbi:MAG: FHA domain-containing protein [Thermoanaerobaculia bacterium]